MAEEKHHHHHLFHHNKDEDKPVETVYTETTTGYAETGNSESTTEGYGATTISTESEVDYRKEEKHHKNLEHLGEMGAVTAGAYALHEKHKSKKDPEHAHKHKIEEEIAAAAAVGAGGYAFHEHHEKKEAKEQDEEAHGKKHHHLLG
ncbi:abscisic stress-ripening protein 2-like [Quercus robur]|uniref:abscisic stress-ripening protein 2-like n=1 Tax=Quercus robur TaxID=38942 RepID=UPI002161A2DC|nr:abscisic stress-ripening protein 2-like [Quercus robur]